jgi:hypothetical protein
MGIEQDLVTTNRKNGVFYTSSGNVVATGSIPFDITGECQQILWQPTLSLSKGSIVQKGQPGVLLELRGFAIFSRRQLCGVTPWPLINFSA